MRSLISVAIITAFATIHADSSPLPVEPEVMGWQTYCAFPQKHHSKTGRGPVVVERVGRASDETRTAYLISDGDKLRIWDIPNKRQTKFNGTDFGEATDDLICPNFKAYGWTFRHNSAAGTIEACRGNSCSPAQTRPNTQPLAYAAANGAVFVGTNYGDALLFRDGQWCRMTLADRRYSCIETQPDAPAEASNQFYSSVQYARRTLIGEYPTGQLYEFDGHQVFPSDLTPPPYHGEVPSGGAEAQSLASYCGDLYVGYWPFGDIWRFDGSEWHGPIRLFSGPPRDDGMPYETQSLRDTPVNNIYGQRVTSMLVHGDALYAVTANKNGWSNAFRSSLTEEQQRDYGVVYRITNPSCSYASSAAPGQ